MFYVIYRHGWNAANQPSQSCPHKLAVARVEADGAAEAKDLARQRVTVYNGQFLSAELAADVDATEAEIDRRVTVTE